MNRLAAAVLDRLPGSFRDRGFRLDRFGLLSWLAAGSRVRSFVVDGDVGAVEGSSGDLGVLRGYARDGSWAPLTVRLLREALAGGGTCVDVGANIGLTTLPIARIPGVACHAFEPDPESFGYLSRNLARHELTGSVTLHPLALFDRAGTLPLAVAAANRGDNRLTAPGTDDPDTAGRRTVDVPLARLDDVLDVASLRRPIAVKIDTQGAEPQVVAGGARLLAEASLVVLEFWPHGMHGTGGDPEALIAFLEARFGSGFVVAGERDAEATWEPIAAVADRLRLFLREGPGRRYLDVFARR